MLTVGMLTDYIKALLEKDERLTDIEVRGEISNLTHHRNGNLYFTLKDEESQIRCVMFRCRDSLQLEHGSRVRVNGSVSVYKPYGSYQLIAEAILPDGMGELHQAFLRIKEKLKTEGLFDQKRTLPSYPQSIGIITAEQGAALQDLLQNISRRYPQVTIFLAPALVQGTRAAPSIIQALRGLQKRSPDVIILARGGGSLEDLWSFNDESLARELYQFPIPTVSAVGHETDFTIADFVADVRAPTPSTAAELVVPDRIQLRQRLHDQQVQLTRLITKQVVDHKQRLSDIRSRPVLRKIDLINTQSQYLDILTTRLHRAYTTSIASKRMALDACAARLKTLDPNDLLRRGYCAVSCDGLPIASAASLNPTDMITLAFHDGERYAEVKK
ncbi:MAG: exodeoxyribonuclease VII large subunit [Nanobdellota archaeon]